MSSKLVIRVGAALIVVGGVSFWWTKGVGWLLVGLLGVALIAEDWIQGRGRK